MFVSSCREVIGPKKDQQKEWISAKTLSKIEERKQKKEAINNSRTRAAKAKAHIKYSEVNKEVKRNIKADKRDYVESLAKRQQQRDIRSSFTTPQGNFQGKITRERDQ